MCLSRFVLNTAIRFVILEASVNGTWWQRPWSQLDRDIWAQVWFSNKDIDGIQNCVIECDVRPCGLDQCQKILECPRMFASRNFQMLQSRGAWVSLLFCLYSSGAWESHQHWIGALTWGQLGGMMEMLERQEQDENNNWTGKLRPIAPVPSHLQ